MKCGLAHRSAPSKRAWHESHSMKAMMESTTHKHQRACGVCPRACTLVVAVVILHNHVFFVKYFLYIMW